MRDDRKLWFNEKTDSKAVDEGRSQIVTPKEKPRERDE
jgi:hypothetical protein